MVKGEIDKEITQNNHIYKIKTLYENDNIIIYSFDFNIIHCFDCVIDLSKKEIISIYLKQEDNDLDMKEFDDGSRIEYFGLGNQLQFGYYYNNESELIYKGSFRNFKREGFGVILNNNIIQYIGFFSNDNCDGYGGSYDLRGEFNVFGYWCDGKEVGDVVHLNQRNDLRKIHKGVKTVHINHVSCYNSEIISQQGPFIEELYITCKYCYISNLIFDSYLHLKKLVFCSDSFGDSSSCKSLTITNMTELEQLVIQDDSFFTITQFRLENCNRLERIYIGSHCFGNCRFFHFNSKFINEFLICRLVPIIFLSNWKEC